MKKQEPKTKEVPRIVWYLECHICKKEITGNYREQALRNLELHVEKHKRKGDKKNDILPNKSR